MGRKAGRRKTPKVQEPAGRPAARKRISRAHVPRVTKELGALIAEERRARRRGQEELAAAAGISQPALSYLERGIFYPRVETLERLAAALGWELDDFIAEARRRAGQQREKI